MKISTGIAATLAACIIMTAYAQKPSDENHDEAYLRNMTIFSALTKELEENYVDSIRTSEAFKAAIGAMVSTVDPYTEYFDSEDQEKLLRMTTGGYTGIGSYIHTVGGNTYISQPIDGSPARLAGLKEGDMIIKVDTTDTRGMATDKVSGLLRGTPGTTVRVTVERPYSAPGDSIRTFDIVREQVIERSVPWWGTLNDGQTGYIRLTQFISSSAEDVRTALDAFKANPEIKNLVLDLRGNGGGLVDSAIEILGYFLPKGTEVLRTGGKHPEMTRTYKTRHQPILADMPMVVLIDGGSASAAEIVAGALQDLDRAVLVGNRSFGKGLVQSTHTLPFSTMVKITTAKYYMPSGRLIQALDYSRRNADGSVARTPDSLTNIYHTRAGRIVRDGGGLTPDSVVKLDPTTAVVYGLVAGQHVFDYATKYAAQHDTISSDGQFTITDADFEDFVNGIDPDKFKYDKVCNDMVSDLRTAAKGEGYLSPEVEAALDSLNKLLTRDLKSDLYSKRTEIEDYINVEIAGRYLGEGGRTRQALNNDKTLQQALGILNNPTLYRDILSTPATTAKKGKK
ncbi:MAG: S41 family peptidase [Muribaculaceae bacterium]|nr:S41 family peptidase [Muribaculaceae bacterium]